ncbi:MAG: CHAD domain-containing protein [Acidobacteria bacterium]|nr:CHAD domain-containing protein [Acidobacteriota bacterium]
MARPLKIKKVSPLDRADETAVRILRARLKEFYLHWPDPELTATPQQIHNLRISGKRLRYSAESLREFYPDQLALMIDLLKRSQDLLGEIQDCMTQRTMIEEDLKRLKKRNDESKDIPVLEKIIAVYDQRHSLLFTQFREIWRGMTIDEFRDSLKKMISRTISRETKSDDGLLYLINPS